MAQRPGGASIMGSSPLARGLPSVHVSFHKRRGIIPARAGFTVVGASVMDSLTDHPRSRGVYDTCVIDRPTGAGSSPLARGLLDPALDTFTALGIIPARAGFTKAWAQATQKVTGSSPLARGLRRCSDRGRRGRGIIPARAGFTHYFVSPVCCNWDHPRSRGVYSAIFPPQVTPTGSSPLARGLQIVKDWIANTLGIIPARAGFTDPTSSVHGRSWDHPRSRGVYSKVAVYSIAAAGSSPLARGLPIRA